jgi:hypothetical protein
MGEYMPDKSELSPGEQERRQLYEKALIKLVEQAIHKYGLEAYPSRFFQLIKQDSFYKIIVEALSGKGKPEYEIQIIVEREYKNRGGGQKSHEEVEKGNGEPRALTIVFDYSEYSYRQAPGSADISVFCNKAYLGKIGIEKRGEPTCLFDFHDERSTVALLLFIANGGEDAFLEIEIPKKKE